MQIILYLMLFISIMAAMDSRGENRLDALNDQGRAVAEQMMAYHKQAAMQCSSAVCPAGVVAVDVGAFLGSGFTSQINNRFRSVSNGTDTVVTRWLGAGGPDTEYIYGLVNAALRADTKGSAVSGPYNTATQSVSAVFVNTGQPHDANGLPVPGAANTGTDVQYGRSLPQGTGGQTFVADEPIILTQVH